MEGEGGGLLMEKILNRKGHVMVETVLVFSLVFSLVVGFTKLMVDEFIQAYTQLNDAGTYIRLDDEANPYDDLGHVYWLMQATEGGLYTIDKVKVYSERGWRRD